MDLGVVSDAFHPDVLSANLGEWNSKGQTINLSTRDGAAAWFLYYTNPLPAGQVDTLEAARTRIPSFLCPSSIDAAENGASLVDHAQHGLQRDGDLHRCHDHPSPRPA